MDDPENHATSAVRAPIAVLLVSDDPLAVAGLVAVLSNEPGIAVVGECTSVAALAVAVALRRPDVVVLHAGEPGAAAPTPMVVLRRCVRSLALDGVGTVVLGLADSDHGLADPDPDSDVGHGRDPDIETGSGADDGPTRVVLSADVRAEDVAAAVRRAGARPEGRRGRAAPGDLTEQEARILALMAQGLSNLRIAERVDESEETVRDDVARLFEKLRLRNRIQAVSYAHASGLLRRPQ